MSEFVDLVNKRGEIQLRNIPRHEVPNYAELYMQIAIVIAVDSLQRVLVHRRGVNKKVDPEKYDHICGGLMSGETPEEAAAREGFEETGVTLKNIRRVHSGINEYDRWRHLLVAEAEGEPNISNTGEVMWVGYCEIDELRQRHEAGEGFVDGFFEDIELALSYHELPTPDSSSR